MHSLIDHSYGSLRSRILLHNLAKHQGSLAVRKRTRECLFKSRKVDIQFFILPLFLPASNAYRVQVFEHMEMNLRELTRKVGVGCGIKIDAVAQLAFQMLIALKHLQVRTTLSISFATDPCERPVMCMCTPGCVLRMLLRHRAVHVQLAGRHALDLSPRLLFVMFESVVVKITQKCRRRVFCTRT